MLRLLVASKEAALRSSNSSFYFLGAAEKLHYSVLHPILIVRFLGLFVFMALVGLVPATHYLISDEVFHIYGIPMLWLVSMAVLYLTGGLAYGSCIPERLCPGKFDIWVGGIYLSHIVSCARNVFSAVVLSVFVCR